MDQVVLSFCSLSLLVLAGKYLRVRIKFLQRLYLPSCVIGGMLGLAAVQSVILLRGTELAEIGGLFGRLVEQVTRVGLLETCTA